MFEVTLLQLPASPQPHMTLTERERGKEWDDLVFLENVGIHLLFISFILYIS